MDCAGLLLSPLLCNPVVEIFMGKGKYHLPPQSHVDVSYQRKIQRSKCFSRVLHGMPLGFQMKLFQQRLCLDSKHKEIIYKVFAMAESSELPSIDLTTVYQIIHKRLILGRSCCQNIVLAYSLVSGR